MSEKSEKTQKEILEIIEAGKECRSSFALESNSRGTTVKVKIYSGDDDELVKHACDLAKNYFKALKEEFSED